MLFYLALLLPLLGGGVLPLLRFRSVKARAVYVETVVCATTAVVWVLLMFGRGSGVELYRIFGDLSLTFRLDGMGCVFAGLVSLLWPLASLYGFEYMAYEERPNAFFTFYTMSYAATLAVAFSGSLFTLYVFYECLTLITLPLVVHKQDSPSAKAGRQYLTYSITGAAMAFTAMVFVIYYTGGSTGFVLGGALDPARVAGKETVLQWVFLLAFVGFGTKAAVFPMYAWLPRASVAPTPVTALLHAVAVVNTGAFAVLRVIYYSFGADLLQGSAPQAIAVCLACVTILFGSAMALKEQHFKRRLAYSTVSNLSYMLLGAALMTPAGMVGSLCHLVLHGVMKITLFYCAGAVLVYTRREYVQDLRGYRKVMPYTCGVYLVAALAMVGIPGLCGFVSKWNLLTAAGERGGWLGALGVATLLVSAVLTACYLLGPAIQMYFLPLNADVATQFPQRRDPGWMMKVPLAALAAAAVVLGLWSKPLVLFLRSVAAGTAG